MEKNRPFSGNVLFLRLFLLAALIYGGVILLIQAKHCSQPTLVTLSGQERHSHKGLQQCPMFITASPSIVIPIPTLSLLTKLMEP